MGLLQDQGVHATEEHLYALLDLARREKLARVFVHVFSDGRDTPPRSALTYIDRLERKMAALGVGTDRVGHGPLLRDGSRPQLGPHPARLRLHGAWQVGLHAPSAKVAIEHAYARADATLAARANSAAGQGTLIESDEFVQPTLITGPDGAPLATIQAGDGVVHFNYRQDRAIQLTRAFVDDDFTALRRAVRASTSAIAASRATTTSFRTPCCRP